MNHDHETISQLIGAWAVDACSPEEASLVQAHLPGCTICTGEAHTLRATATALLTPAPAGLRERLHAAMPLRRRPAPRAPGYAKPYAAQVAALDLLLSALGSGEWQLIAAYERMTVRDLLAHLMEVDGVVAGALGLPVRTTPSLDSWREQAEAVCRALPHEPDNGVTVKLGRRMTVADALLARAFETWIHTEDIAGATGSPTVTPLPSHLHPMADLAVRMLPAVTGRVVTGRSISLHLTGEGGGRWTVPVSAGPVVSESDAGVTVDVVEFCRLVGDRREPSLLDVEISGDPVLAREWLAAVPALAPYP
ncbi:maleylpyruvate isomerase N-terminal domain-containing protein [Actinoplanes sp. GCM10030250]|uniref:maleylpyruvate isomerase N-terminal domain-containing protein n=1 Tax=Actinoplanes sp. GCM10030250 TaxID=3273376 RepID=UPI00361E9763